MTTPFNPLTITSVLLIPRWTEAVLGVERLLLGVPEVRPVAFARDRDEAVQFRRHWPETAPPLILIHVSESLAHNRAVEVILQIASHQPPSGVAVLILDGPELSGFEDRGRRVWNCELAAALESKILDLQVIEYAPSWSTSPPRIR